ncbi:hypothetical protein Tco_1048800, partial [Tanacetum coccineum]
AGRAVDCQLPLMAVNHAYLCFDPITCVIRPEIITYRNSNKENLRPSHLNAEHSQVHAGIAQNEADTSAYMDLADCDKLFRTARDRCRAGDVPRFKIRLYNMGGVRGYELPTSGVLGGIVFKDGPKSRTDFDVIIEFRGGPLLALKYVDLYGIILDIVRRD